VAAGDLKPYAGASDAEQSKSAFERAGEWLIYGAAAIACGISLFAACGWWWWRDLRIGAGRDAIPMAPSTALILMILGVAVLLRQRWGDKAAVRAVIFIAAGIAAVPAIIAGVQHFSGLALPWEGLLLRDNETVRGIPLGHMSPLSAGALLLAAASLAALVPPQAGEGRVLEHAGMALASPGLAAGIVIALAYAEGTPFFYGGSTIPMALPTAVALVAVNLALLTTAISLIRRPAEGAGGPAFRPVSSRGRIERNLVAIIGVLILGIALAGLFSVRSQQASIIGMTLIVLLLGAVFTALHRLRRINEGFLYAKLSAETERRSLAERLALVTRHANDIILLMDGDKRIVEANDRAVTAYGYTLEEFRQLPPGGLRPDSTKGSLPEQLDPLESMGGVIFETVHRRKDGTTFPVEISGRSIEIEGQQFSLGIYRDLTRRKAYEREIERLNRLYSALSEINGAIVRVKTREEAFGKVCQALVENGGFKLAWIGWVEPATSAVTVVGQAGDETGYLRGIRIYCDDRPEGRGPTGTSIREGQPCVCNDFAGDPSAEPWREAAERAGIAAWIALPISDGGVVRGALTVYAAEKNAFGPKETSLLEEAVRDISFALEHLEVERKRSEAELALREAYQFNQEIICAANEGIIVYGPDLRYQVWNPYMERLTGFPAAKVLGRHPREIFPFLPGVETEGVLENVLAGVLPGPCTFQFHDPRTGRSGWVAHRTAPLRNTDGAIIGVVKLVRDITERKQAEAALTASEHRYRRLFESAKDGILILDAETGMVMDVNPFLIDTLCISRNQFLSKKIWELGLFSDIIASQASFAELQKNKYIRYEDKPLQTADGRRLDVEFVSNVYLVDGKRVIQCNIRDITERKRAEGELRESHKMLQRVINNIPQQVFWKDRDLNYLGANAVFARSGGLSNPEDIIGKSDFELAWKDSAEAYRADDRTVIKSGIAKLNYEEEQKRPDGGFFWLRTSKLPLVDDAGKILGMLGIYEDITERKRAEESLRNLSRIVEQAPLSIVITNLSGAIEYVNPRFCSVTGYSQEEVRGKNPRILKSDQTPPQAYQDMWRKLTRGEIWNGELRNRKKNGEVFLESVVIAPVVDETGRTTHYVALKDDITAQRRSTEEAGARIAKEREISEMKSRFISLISHEFRTPLTAAMASAELLHNHLNQLAPAKREELFVRINSSVLRLTGMLDDVLALNRADSENSELRLAPTDLPLFLRDATEEVRLGDHDAHRFELLAGGDLAAFVTDTNLLRHIVSNLLGNAARYSPAGTLITMRTEADSQGMRLSVEDQGIGIPWTDRGRIFEPFERGSNVGATKGSGLGLSIVKRMTRLLGGSITVVSAEGGGSRFTLVLPRLKARATLP
jgi:PAS domain S-box-containing protein